MPWKEAEGKSKIAEIWKSPIKSKKSSWLANDRIIGSPSPSFISPARNTKRSKNDY